MPRPKKKRGPGRPKGSKNGRPGRKPGRPAKGNSEVDFKSMSKQFANVAKLDVYRGMVVDLVHKIEVLEKKLHI